MKTKLRLQFIAALLLLALARITLHAQLVADGETLNLTTVTNLSASDLIVGMNAGGTTLNLIAPGAVTADEGYVGMNTSSSNNKVTIQNSGALCNTGSFFVGHQGSDNLLVISNGGWAINGIARIGYLASSGNNTAIVTGTNSVWNNNFNLFVGQVGSGNLLVISNSGVVFCGTANIGFSASSSNNAAVVTGPGSLWHCNNNILFVGNSGSFNTLLITNGGAVVAGLDTYLGSGSSSSNNLMRVDNGTFIVTNGSGSGTLDVRRGNILFNGGSINAQRLLLDTGPSGTFTFNGGTLITGRGTINNAQDFAVGVNAGFAPATWNVQSNTTLANGLDLGSNAANATLLLTNGATLSVGNATSFALISSRLGVNAGSTNHLAVVSGLGSLWTNSGGIWLGDAGAGNRVVISNGATVAAAVLIVGRTVSSSNNVLTVSNGTVTVNNPGLTGTLDVRRGSVLLQNGTITTDHLLLTNGASSVLTFNGGTLNIASATVSNGAPFAIGNGSSNATLNFIGSGTRTFANGLKVSVAAAANLTNGLVNAGFLTATNAGGALTFNGGTLVTDGGNINNGQPFIVGASAGFAPATWDVRGNTSPTTVAQGLRIGGNAGNATLLLTNGATLSVINSASRVGESAFSTGNQAQISGSGSVWETGAELAIGQSGGQNRLLVSGGGAVRSASGVIGLGGFSVSEGNNNTALITGAGSLWTNNGSLAVGTAGSGNQLVVSNGATVRSFGATIGGGSIFAADAGRQNTALLTDADSLWVNNGDLFLGGLGRENQLIVTNSATLVTSNLYVGISGGSTSNRLTVHGGTASLDGMLDIRRGTSVLNAGLIDCGMLLLTNNAGLFEFNGGTFAPIDSTVNNGSAFVVGNGVSAATYQLQSNGLHTFNNGLTIANNATLAGFGGTAATIAGTLTIQPGGRVDLSYPTADTLILSNSPVLSGQVIVQFNKIGPIAGDQIQVKQPLTYGGSLTVNYTGGSPMTLGDTVILFKAPSYGGAFTTLTLPALSPGLMWTNQLLVNGTIKIVAQTPPAISGLLRSGKNLVFTVTGGSPGGSYTLLTSTNAALPVLNWTTDSTGNLDWLGNVTLTNAINPTEPQRYFTVRAP
jgi:T5SS/PEP-CTERM-associated repeat protein